MRYWIEPVESPEGDKLSQEVKVVDDDGKTVARGGLEVAWVTGYDGGGGEFTASVAFVGMAVE